MYAGTSTGLRVSPIPSVSSMSLTPFFMTFTILILTVSATVVLPSKYVLLFDPPDYLIFFGLDFLHNLLWLGLLLHFFFLNVFLDDLYPLDNGDNHPPE